MKMRFALFALGFVMALAANASQATASLYVWEDPKYQIVFSFPDEWVPQGALTWPEIYRLVADGQDKAECTLYSHYDRRFMVYPRRYMDDVVNEEMDWGYWEKHFANSDNVYFHYDREGGLGAGDARYALVDFDKTVGAETHRKRAFVFATIYADLQVVFQCESLKDRFTRYEGVFGSVTGSIQFKPKYAPEKQGMYRDFLTLKK